MHTVTKTFRDLPAAHRQPRHDGHCRWIHGHNWAFDITWIADSLDENGFVVDVGKLESVKKLLQETFDHTLLLNATDPFLVSLKETLGGEFADIVVVPNCGMEGLAEWVFHHVRKLNLDHGDRNLRVVEVVCWEDSKNRATFRL